MSETKEEPITVRALRGNRTLTSFRTVAFEATAYTNSATKAKQSKSRRNGSGNCSRRLGGSAKTGAATRRFRRLLKQPVREVARHVGLEPTSTVLETAMLPVAPMPYVDGHTHEA